MGRSVFSAVRRDNPDFLLGVSHRERGREGFQRQRSTEKHSAATLHPLAKSNEKARSIMEDETRVVAFIRACKESERLRQEMGKRWMTKCTNFLNRVPFIREERGEVFKINNFPVEEILLKKIGREKWVEKEVGRKCLSVSHRMDNAERNTCK